MRSRRKIMQHEIEEAALKKEKDALSQEHLKEIQKELAEMREQFNAMKAKWDNEKAAIGKVQKLREEIEQVNGEIEKAERELRPEQGRRAANTASCPRCKNSWRRRRRWPRAAEKDHPAPRQGHRGGDRPDCRRAGPAFPWQS